MHRIYNDEFECAQTFEFSLSQVLVALLLLSLFFLRRFLARAFLSAEVHFKRHGKMKCGLTEKMIQMTKGRKSEKNMEIQVRSNGRQTGVSASALKIIVPKIRN